MNWLKGWCMAGMEEVFGEGLSQGNAPHQSAWLKVLAGLKQTQHCEGSALKAQPHFLEVLHQISMEKLLRCEYG